MNNKSIISPVIKKLYEEINNNNYIAIENFWNKLEKQGTPLIEPIEEDCENVLLTFLYRDSKELENVIVYGGVPGFRYGENKLERLENSDIWYRTYKVRNDIKFKYQFCKNYIEGDKYSNIKEKSIIDAFNSRVFKLCRDNEDPESVESVDSYVEIGNVEKEVWTSKRSNITEGKIALHRMNHENHSFRIWVYTPFGYEENIVENNLLVLTDGFDHIYHLNCKEVLDNLMYEKKIDPTVTVFIENSDNRYEELTCSEKFSIFIVDEVIPWIKDNYRVTNNPEKTTISGLSLGGLFASYVGLKYSNIFGNVLSQSGSYWWEEGWLTERYKEHEKLPLRMYLNVGVLEDRPYDDEPIMMDYINDMRDVLIEKGYEVHYEQFQSAHDYLSWGEFLGRGLIKLFSE